ncbi:hypothetical protein OKA06_14815 [Novosphingobium sp. MW5]|nr:hypothetical protein [Novosphingobium sp. MW5]
MTSIKRIGAVALVAALALSLSACLLTPGKFVSALDLRKDGQFTFSYKGEMSLYGIAQIAAMDKGADQPFKESPCYDYDAPAEAAKSDKPAAKTEDDTFADPKERPCTKQELADQKADWEATRKETAERKKKDLEEMKAVLGGLDPTDPKSIEEFAARLRRQAGWKLVTYKGNGLFDIDFAIAGRADHDFIFPIIEKFPTTNTFVQVLRRADGTVRIDAPGFNPNSYGNPMGQCDGHGNDGRHGQRRHAQAGRDGRGVHRHHQWAGAGQQYGRRATGRSCRAEADVEGQRPHHRSTDCADQAGKLKRS